MDIYKYNDINISKISFKKPNKINNYYYSDISYNNKPLYLQTGKLNCITDLQNINKKNPYLEFKINEFNLYDFFINIDDIIIKETYNNSKKWFRKSIPLDIIDDMYKRITKPVKENNIPTIKFNLPMLKGKHVCNIYDQNKIRMNIQDIPNDLNMISIIHIKGIKILKQNYICDLYINQIKVYIPKEIDYNISEKCLIENEDYEKDIDYEAIEENKIINKIKLLKENVKKENILIKEHKSNIELINKEIKNLKKNIN